jgi:hypothetical protein
MIGYFNGTYYCAALTSTVEASCGCAIEVRVPTSAPIQNMPTTPTAGSGSEPTDASTVSSSFAVSTTSAWSFVGIAAVAVMTSLLFSG